MSALNNSKWERFCQELFIGKTITQAANEAGYSPKYCYSIGSRLSKKVEIIARIKELNEAAASAKVASVLERKERLSEIIRARMTDFVHVDDDGSHIDIDKQSLHNGAVQEVTTKSKFFKDGHDPLLFINVKLRDPVAAIQELNKMEGVYPAEKLDVTTGGEKMAQPVFIVADTQVKATAEQVLKEPCVN